MKKRILISICIFAFVIICIPVTKRAHEEYREHFTFRNIRNIPSDNGIPRLYLTTNSGKLVLSKEYWSDSSYKLYENGILLNSGKIKIKGRGNTTWDKPKKSYALKFEDKTSLLGMSYDKRWVLLNPYNDKSLLRNDFALSLGSVYDNIPYTPQFRQIEVVMNGKFFGVYQLAEKIRLSNERVNLPYGGYIIEKDRARNPNSFITNKGSFAFVVADADEDFYKKDHSSIQYQTQELEDAIYTEDFNIYSNYIDISSFIDWYLINEFTKNHDAKMQLSVYLLFNPSDKKFYFGPIWDFDISSGNINYDGCEKTSGLWIADANWVKQILKSTEVKNMIKFRWNETKEILLNQINTYIPLRAEKLSKAQEWNFKAWRILDIHIWPNAVVPGTYEGEVEYLIDWLNQRWQWFDNTINDMN